MQSPLGSWQAKNWDPEVGSTRFNEFCAVLDKPLIGMTGTAETVAYDESTNMVTVPGGLDVPLTVYNYATFIKEVSGMGPLFCEVEQ